MSAEERHAVLSQMLGANIGLIHGRMSGPEKDAAMLAFKNGETRLLVATTVVEVGVDVPDATIMVIEHAERFGLAQLHQLRGPRRRRGDEASTCILLYKGPLSENGRARLSILRDSEDGFLIAEEDLKLRGEGNCSAHVNQARRLRIASLEAHADLLEIARKDAAYVIERDPELTGPRGDAYAPCSTCTAATKRSASARRLKVIAMNMIDPRRPPPAFRKGYALCSPQNILQPRHLRRARKRRSARCSKSPAARRLGACAGRRLEREAGLYAAFRAGVPCHDHGNRGG